MNKLKIIKYLAMLASMLLLSFVLMTSMADAKGSFGGSRGGMGGGRSFGGSRGGLSSRSFGGSSSRSSGGLFSRSSTMPRTSFGGNRMSSGLDYTRRYGIPRQTIPAGQMAGIPNNYILHDYGGYGSGLLTGYLMGRSSWLWYTPFSRAFYYSAPYYVENADGTVEAYPPTFSWSKVFFTIMIFGGIGYIIFVVIRSRRRGGTTAGIYRSQSSFS